MELRGKRVAVLAEDIYENLELWYPYMRAKEAGAEVKIVGPKKTTYKSKEGFPAEADMAAGEARVEDFDAVVIPGGYAPDKMRRDKALIDFVRGMHDAGKPVAFICHAGWVPISAGIVNGRTVTSVAAIKDDLVNAGANWVDEEVVVDGNLISSRTPADLPAFGRALVEALTTEKVAVGAD
ncbi:MAG: type 1 glutamine amidotransferase domain-containing protein [Dehalococcoidia bacterium]